MKIGVISDSFRLNLHDGLKKAAEVGAQGVQITRFPVKWLRRTSTRSSAAI